MSLLPAVTTFKRHLAIAAVMGSAFLASWASAQVQTIDKVVAIVDDDIVLASELVERLDAFKIGIQRRGMEMPDEETLVKETLDRLILESIQLQLADRYGVRIPDAQLDDAMSRLASQNGMTLEQFRGVVEGEGKSFVEMRAQIRQEMMIQRVQQGNVSRNIQISEPEVENYLATEEGQLMTQPEFHVLQALVAVSKDDSSQEVADKEAFVDRVLASILAGRSFEEAVKILQPYAFTGGDLGWRKLPEIPSMFAEILPILKAGNTGKVQSDSGFHLVYLADARGGEQLVQQTEVRHILVKPTEVMSDSEAETLTAELRQRILDGEDFTELAKKYSDDIGSAQEGGELGWTSPGQMVPEFESAMAATPQGEVSEPVRSQFGWHILQVTDRREQDVSDDMRRRQVMGYLHDQKYQEELEAWLRKIRDEAFVDIK